MTTEVMVGTGYVCTGQKVRVETYDPNSSDQKAIEVHELDSMSLLHRLYVHGSQAIRILEVERPYTVDTTISGA